MQYKQIINGVDFAPYIREDGVQQNDVLRNDRRIITLDGTLHMSAITKRRLSIRLREMRDETMRRLFSALGSPATVEYTDFEKGDVKKIFYVTSKSIGVRTVKGGNTYWRNASFTLEEK